MSVLTVTFNPAIDQSVKINKLSPGTKHIAYDVQEHIGGKAINVASILADWGESVQVTGAMGRENADFFEAEFRKKNIKNSFIKVPGFNRKNIKIIDGLTTTDINLPGISITDYCVERVAKVIELHEGTLVLAGSLPKDCPETVYKNLLSRFGSKNRHIFLDVDGKTLKKSLEAPNMPFCIKPNREELEEFMGEPAIDDASFLHYGKQLLGYQIPLVILSLGADGAFFMTREHILKASLAASHIESAVGAGDAMIAGVISALKESSDLNFIASLATAFSVAKIAHLGPNLPSRSDILELLKSVKIKEVAIS